VVVHALYLHTHEMGGKLNDPKYKKAEPLVSKILTLMTFKIILMSFWCHGQIDWK
jgi:hypothetical protein